MHVEPFRVDVDEATLADLRGRLARARFPSQVRNAGWAYGANVGYLRELVEYWLDAYDWRAQEAALNRFPHFLADVDGRKLHYIHARAARDGALTLVLSHGWPGSVFEFHKVIEPLTHPENFGGDAADAFHVICPSLTGYGWSEPWLEEGCDIRMVAERQVKLMKGLGIERYGVQGGDWGGLVSPYMAVIAPELVMTQGRLIGTWMDARLAGAAAATAWFVWRRDMLGTIIVGTGVMLIFRMGLGW